MELKEAIGRRRSIRFLLPHRPVERQKIQRMLEASRLSSFWGNVNALGAVVIERKSAPQEVLEAIPPGTAIGGWQFRLAPVLIVWFVDWRALEVQGDRLHELVDSGAAGVERDASHRYLDERLIPFFKAAMANIKTSGTTQLDCGQGIAQATLVAFEQGLGTCLLGIPLQKKLKRALELPDECDILVVQTVGYPAESPEAGGQRPRLPFEQRYYLNRYAETFPRDPEVVEGLERDKMLQKPAPLPWRWAELEYLARALDIPPIFGEEVEGITQEMLKEMSEASGKS